MQQRFRWEDHNIDDLRAQYDDIGITQFMVLHGVSYYSVLDNLGQSKGSRSRRRIDGKERVKLEIKKSADTIVKEFHEKLEAEEAPKYDGPWKYLMNRKLY